MLLAGMQQPSSAADPSTEDKIILMQASSDGLISDLQYMVKELAKKQQQWGTNIEPNIELFLDGVDRSKPIRVDAFFDEKLGEYYRPFFPVSDLSKFRNNLDALGITSAPVGKNLFRLESAFEGQMRVLSNYAAFAPQEWLKIIPETLADPATEIAPLTKAKYDGAVLIDNHAEGIEKRRQSLARVRSNALAEIKKKSTESLDEYNFRKLLAENHFDELAQYYAELDYLEGGWVTDADKKQGVGTLILSALPGTELEENFKLIPTLKSRFANLPAAEPLVASGRMQIPVLLPAQKRLSKTYQAYIPVINQKIDGRKEMSNTEKQTAKDAVQKVVTLLEKGFQLGTLDTFMDMRPAKKPGLQEAIGGVQVVDGREVEEIVKMLPQISKKFTVKSDVATENDFHFHEVELSDNIPPMLESLFGTPCRVSVATSDSLLLVGFGETSLEWLKQTAEHLKNQPESKTLPEFVRFKGHIHPFVKALSARDPNENRPQLRDMLLEAFSQGDDLVEFTDKYEDNQVRGSLIVEPGLLRFLGLAVAKFAEENL